MALQEDSCRASGSEDLHYLGRHHSGLQRQETCLRAVVQFPLVTLEAHPLHPAGIHRSISSDWFGVSVTVPPK